MLSFAIQKCRNATNFIGIWVSISNYIMNSTRHYKQIDLLYTDIVLYSTLFRDNFNFWKNSKNCIFLIWSWILLIKDNILKQYWVYNNTFQLEMPFPDVHFEMFSIFNLNFFQKILKGIKLTTQPNTQNFFVTWCSTIINIFYI